MLLLPVELLRRKGEGAECGHCAKEAGERSPQLWFACEAEASRNKLLPGLAIQMSAEAKTIAITK
jgi:hypothetical protein